MLRMVGQRTWPVTEIMIQPVRGMPGKVKRRGDRNVFEREAVAPFMPERITDLYHPGGNSLCYCIQTAHLMGCNPIYAMGFTLESGTGHFHGLDNPTTGRRSVYDAPRALDWLRWYAAEFPGRVRLLPGWQGPVYDALPTEALDDYYRVLGIRSEPKEPSSQQRDADANNGAAARLW